MDTDFTGDLSVNGTHLNGKSQNELSKFRNLNFERFSKKPVFGRFIGSN